MNKEQEELRKQIEAVRARLEKAQHEAYQLRRTARNIQFFGLVVGLLPAIFYLLYACLK